MLWRLAIRSCGSTTRLPLLSFYSSQDWPQRAQRGHSGVLQLAAALQDEALAAGVTITTIHSSKGLEWPVVFMPTLCDGYLPLRPGAGGGLKRACV